LLLPDVPTEAELLLPAPVEPPAEADAFDSMYVWAVKPEFEADREPDVPVAEVEPLAPDVPSAP